MKPFVVVLLVLAASAARPQATHIKAALTAYEDAQKASLDKRFEQAIALFRLILPDAWGNSFRLGHSSPSQ